MFLASGLSSGCAIPGPDPAPVQPSDAAAGEAPHSPAPPSSADSANLRASPARATLGGSSGPFFVGSRGYGTDAYGGPLDVVFNRGLVVTQWRNRDRNVFTYDYAWHSVYAVVRNPGPAMERAGGWWKVVQRHMLPFGGDEIREGQWVPNYFGHVLEGGLAYRRLLEWNRAHGMPFPTLVSVLTTQFAVALNEAYETPADDPWVNDHGTAGTFFDFVVFDPLGMLLFHQDGISRFFAETLGAQLWPTQAAIVIPEGILINNGKSAVYRPKLWFTDRARFFLRTGLGLEAGLSFPRADGYEVSVGAGFQSTKRFLDPVTHVEKAEFAGSAGLWIDRGGALLFALTVDQRTDRLVGVNLFPGVIDLLGLSPGMWFVVDADHRAYMGLTAFRNLGVGLGLGF